VGTPASQRLVRVVLSGIVLYGAGAVAPAPSLSAPLGDADAAGASATGETLDLAPQASGEPRLEPVAETNEPVELPEMRTADSRTVRNANGTYTTEYFADAIHFQDEIGSWQPIEAVPVESDEPGKAFETKRGPVMVHFSDSSLLGDLVTVTGGEDSVRYRASVDPYGVYARYWEAGTPEPIFSGGVVPSVGGRGEHWHTFETNSQGIPPTVWQYLEIRVSGGADTTVVDSVELIVP